MTVEGLTFDLMRITPKDDALLYSALSELRNGVIQTNGDKMALSTSGLNVYVGLGAAVVEGRLIRITEQERVAVPANTTGYICLTIDLTQVNTFTGTPGSTDYLPVNNQVRVEALTSLVQQDLHTTGKIFTYPIASYVSTGSAVTLTSTQLPTAFKINNTNFEIGEIRLDGRMFSFYFTAKRSTALAGVIADVINIPAGFRPRSKFNQMVGGRSAIGRVGQFVVDTNGNMSWYGASGTDLGNVDFGCYVMYPL